MTVKCHHNSNRYLNKKFLRGILIVLLISIIITYSSFGIAFLFGYRFYVNTDTDMEPTICNGDIVWFKNINTSTLNTRDIVLLPSEKNSLSIQRVINIRQGSEGQYLVETKCDARFLSEYWMLNNEGMVYLAFARVPLGGYIIGFLDNNYVRVSLVLLGIVVLIMIYKRYRK